MTASSGGTTAGGSGGLPGSGGTGAASGGAPTTTGGAGPGGTGGAPGGTGGTPGSTGGSGGGAGSGGTAGSGATGGAAGSGGGMVVDPPEHPPLDCGPIGVAIEDAGPTANRVNYVIIGDGYTANEVDTTFMEHIQVAMEKRFSTPIGQPYGRDRKFVNICAIKLVSPTGICQSSALGCCERNPGQNTRLAECNSNEANRQIAENLPEDFEVDWKAVVLNGDDWWNTGSVLMLWSGGHNDAAGAALHEGGHGFHQLADEYCTRTGAACGPNGGGPNGQEYREVNSTGNGTDSGGKWNRWLDWDQAGATGIQGLFAGSRYVDEGQYRPSANSQMNSLFGDNPNTSFNAVSREKMVFDIWRHVTPVDATEPPEGAVNGTPTLVVHVIDPEVINVDWSVDGELVKENGGNAFDLATAGLSSGSHAVSARAYDNAGEDLVRYRDGGEDYGRMNWARSQQTVTWTVTIP